MLLDAEGGPCGGVGDMDASLFCDCAASPASPGDMSISMVVVVVVGARLDSIVCGPAVPLRRGRAGEGARLKSRSVLQRGVRQVEGPYVRLVHTQWSGPLKGARVSCVPHLAYQNFQIRNWGAGTRGFQRSEAKAKSKAGQSTRQSRSRSNDRLGGKLDKRRYTTEVRCRRRAGTSFTAPSLRWSWSWSCVDCPLCRKVDCPENTKEAQLRCRIRPK